MFRYREDRLPVVLILAFTALDFGLYLLTDSLWVLVPYFLLTIVPKGIVSAWNHHHQHAMTFRSPLLNRLLELSYGLHTGMPTHMWVLHHVLGHHLNYLDQDKDESAWARKDGSQMGVWEYTLNVGLTAYPRALRVGKRYPRQRRLFVIFGALTWAVAGLLTWLRPVAGLMLFVLPMLTTIFYTAWVTYDHHAGLHTDDPFSGSHNIMNRWFNRLTGNLGYHTAHHYRQGVHWSKLPTLHAKIADRIPVHCYVDSSFDVVLPDSPLRMPELPDAVRAPEQLLDSAE